MVLWSSLTVEVISFVIYSVLSNCSLTLKKKNLYAYFVMQITVNEYTYMYTYELIKIKLIYIFTSQWKLTMNMYLCTTFFSFAVSHWLFIEFLIIVWQYNNSRWWCESMTYLFQLLNALQLFGANLDDFLHMLLPPVVRLFDSSDVPIAVRRWGI